MSVTVEQFFATLGLKVDQASFDKGEKKVEGLGGLVKKAIAAFAAFKLGGFFKASIGETIELGGHLDDLSQKTGLSAEALQEYGFAAGQGGVALEEFAQATGILSRNLAAAKAGGKEAAASLRKVGISGQALTAALKDGAGLDAALGTIADRFATMPDGPAKTALAMDVFGRSGASLIPTLNLGSAGLASLRQEAKDLGIVLSNADVAGLDPLGDNLDKLKASASGLKNQIVAQLAPAMLDLVQGALEWLKANRALVQSGIKAFVEGLIAAFRIAGTMVKGAAIAFQALSDAGLGLIDVLEAVAIAWGVVELAMLGVGGPVIAILALVALALTEIIAQWGAVKKAVGNFARAARSVLVSFWHWLEGLPSRVLVALSSVWEDIKDGFRRAFEWIADLPVVKQLIELVDKIGDLANAAGSLVPGLSIKAGANPNVKINRNGTATVGSPAAGADAPLILHRPAEIRAAAQRGAPTVTPGTASGGPVAFGDIHTTINLTGSGDPVAQALETRKQFDAHMARVLAHAASQVGGSGGVG